MNQRGNFSFVFFFIVFMVVTTIIFVFFVPMAQNFTVASYNIGERLIDDSNETTNNFTDAGMKAEVQGILSQQKANYTSQIDLLGALNKWSGLIIIILAAISLVLLTRSVVMRQTGGVI